MPEPLRRPVQFGKYYLLDRVNVGGMAEVFRAKALGVEGFERIVAVKRILPAIAEDKEFIEMFIDEAKIAVQFNHANIAQIFDLGKVEDAYFIAMEFIFGKDVRAIFDRCRQKSIDGSTTMPIAQACFLVMKCCEGLDYAHNKRDPQGNELHLVHRDVSPQNILISYEGEIKLIDFGIAKATGRASKTQQGILKGKFGYMSPEQVRGLPLDRRSDVFALGIVLYELLTGERLFVGESDFDTLEKVRNVEILPPSTYNRRISEELERIVMKALARDVDERYLNIIDLHDDLQAYMYAAGEFYSRKDLAAWMKRVFRSEIDEETSRLEAYRQMPLPEPRAQQAAGRRGQAAAPAQGRGSARFPTAPSTLVDPTLNTADGEGDVTSPAGRAGAADLSWDDDERQTNIYDGPDGSPEEPIEELGSGAFVIEGSADDDGPTGAVQVRPLGRAAPAKARPQAAEPMGAPEPLAPRPPEPPKPERVSFALPMPMGRPSGSSPDDPTAAPLTPVVTPTSAQPEGLKATRTALVAGMIGAVLLVCVLAIWGVSTYGRRPGQLVVVSEPATGVQVLIDQKPQPTDGTPATLSLKPGSYVVTVQREGYVPVTQQVEIRAGQATRHRVVLEALAADTGFQVFSDPAGAQVILDGKALDGVTPLKIQAVRPGVHHVEVRGHGNTWIRDVELAAGSMIDLRAELTPPAPPSPVVASPPSPRSPLPRPPEVESPTPASVPVQVLPSPTRPRPESPAVAVHVPRPSSPAPESVPSDAPRPARGGEGFLRLGSKPWTNIAIDGKDTGLHTPQTGLKLPAGTHKITLTNPQFNVKETFTVEIQAGQTETVIKDFRGKTEDSED